MTIEEHQAANSIPAVRGDARTARPRPLSPASCAASSRPAPTPPRKDSVTPPPPAAGATPPSWPRPTAAAWRRSEAVAIDLADLDLLDLGVDSATVQKMAGHAFVSKTERDDRRDRGVQRR